MIDLFFPEFAFKFKQEGDHKFIFDFVRKKYVLLTPEEWVRQNILRCLHEVHHYPKGLLSVEKEITINRLKKRYDIVVYNSEHQPWMLIECKRPEVPINDLVLQQLLRYHTILQCNYWMLTNGLNTFCASSAEGKIEWLYALPAHNR